MAKKAIEHVTDRYYRMIVAGCFLGYSNEAIVNYCIHVGPENFDDRFTGTGYKHPFSEMFTTQTIVKNINRERVCKHPFAPILPIKMVNDGLFVHKDMIIVPNQVAALHYKLVDDEIKKFHKAFDAGSRSQGAVRVKYRAQHILCGAAMQRHIEIFNQMTKSP